MSDMLPKAGNVNTTDAAMLKKPGNVNTSAECVKLSTRIAALTGPCREIDKEMMVRFDGWKKSPSGTYVKGMTHMVFGATRPFTSSLDAIRQLIDKEFAGTIRGCDQCFRHDDPEQGVQGFEAYCNFYPGKNSGTAFHGNEAIAYCIAYVKAMEANNETDS